MEATIFASAVLLGLAGAPHCTAMCAGPCAALVGRANGASAANAANAAGAAGAAAAMRPSIAFHAARIAGYAAAGAAVAGGLATMGALAQAAPVLRPLWVLVHAALLALGLCLLWQGRQPALLASFGRRAQPVPAAPRPPALAAATAVAGWAPMAAPAPRSGSRRSLQAGAAGALWFAWPCGLLQSALLVAALSNSAAGGALAMAGFAIASSAGLVLAPLLWRRLGRAGSGRAERWGLRGAGLLMATLSGWALTQGLWHRVAEFCATLL